MRQVHAYLSLSNLTLYNPNRCITVFLLYIKIHTILHLLFKKGALLLRVVLLLSAIWYS